MSSLKEFLRKISMIESSGGKDTNHPVMQSGLHQGMSAIGKYGLMPNTIQEVARRNRKHEQLGYLANMTPEQIDEEVRKNPILEQLAAEKLAEHVINKQGGDEVKAAYSWNMGHNLSPKKIEQRQYLDNPYVKKFQKLQLEDMKRQPASEPPKKELPPKKTFLRLSDLLNIKNEDENV
jgi:hypothetical protein